MRHRREVRRNPPSRTAKNPMVVLVRRFDPSGETLPSWKALAGAGTVELLSAPAAKRAALNPPRDADLRVGDLIAVVPVDFISDIDAHVKSLFVVTPDGVKAAPKPPAVLGGPWLVTWGQNAGAMLRVAKGADRRRLTMAACDCADTVIGDVWSPKARKALAAARAWCRGATSAYDVGYAAYEARHPRERPGPADMAAAHAAGVVAGRNAHLAAEDAADAFAWSADGAGTHRSHVARHLGTMGPLVDRWLPLPVVLLSLLGYPEVIPFDPSMVPVTPRENPRRRSRR